MKILLAISDTTNLDMVRTVLLAEGHDPCPANDGQAVLTAMHEKPDMVIMDAELTGISGYECCRQIKHDDKNRHKPIVLLMPTQGTTAWARFSECGADDFIELPLHPHIVKAKIRLLLHISELYHRLDASHRHAKQEIRLAKHMFDSITKRQPKEVDFLHFWGLSAGHFCGDLFIFERTPEHHLHVFLGDFTGHGLAAAMGALPVSDIFFAMTRNGEPLERIIAAINHKLYDIMPTGKFCAAVFMRLEADYSRLEFWNGGLPPILLVDRQHKIVGNFESAHLPLGIVDPTECIPATGSVELSGIHSVVLCSDGLIEAQNALGECYGEERLAQALTRNSKDSCLFNRVKSSALHFLEGLEPHDDVSLAVININ